MKFTKLSLVAALLIGSSAFAVENIKVGGDAKLFYSTQNDTNANAKADLFQQESSSAEAAVNVGITADLTTGISSGVTISAITTLGLENNLVSGTWTGGTTDEVWFSDAWLAGTAGKTTGKIGRMALDTPLVFTETWSVVQNTFEAAVLVNQDIPNTTLVGAYVGKSNHGEVLGGGVTAHSFTSFYNGAYAIGAVNNSFEPLTVSAWYFDATSTVKSYWLQADLDMSGIIAGIQYTSQEAQTTTAETQSAFSAKLGYEMKDTFAVSAAFSQVDDKNGMNNVGANYAGAQSKLYTEAWWYYGVISKPDTQAYNVTATGSVSDIDLGVYYTAATIGDGVAVGTDADFAEATFEVAKSFGPLDAGLYYIYTKYDVDNSGDAYDTVQVYLTYNY